MDKSSGLGSPETAVDDFIKLLKDSVERDLPHNLLLEVVYAHCYDFIEWYDEYIDKED